MCSSRAWFGFQLIIATVYRRQTYCLKHADRPDAGGVGSVFGFVERNSYVGLCGEVVYLVRCDLFEQRNQPGSVTEVAVVEECGST